MKEDRRGQEAGGEVKGLVGVGVQDAKRRRRAGSMAGGVLRPDVHLSLTRPTLPLSKMKCVHLDLIQVSTLLLTF